jgi:hypothetical protein
MTEFFTLYTSGFWAWAGITYGVALVIYLLTLLIAALRGKP